MSGRKQVLVSLDQAEYRRLNDAEMKLRFTSRDVSGILQDLQQHNREWIQQENNNSAARARAYEGYLQGLGIEIQNVEQRTMQTIHQQQQAFAGAFSSLQSGMMEHTQNLLQQQALFSEDLAATTAQNSALLQTLMAQRDEQGGMKRATARSWIRDAYNLGKHIVDTYDFRKFAPGKVEAIEQKLWQAQDNLANNMAEAAVLGAQECFREFSALRTYLEAETARHSALTTMASNVLAELKAMGEANRHVPAMDLEGKELEVDLDIDLWSGNRFSRWMETIEAYQRQVSEAATNLDTLALRTLVQVTAPEMETRLQKIIFQARMAVINSQLRINIADIVLRALKMQGFDLQEAAYEQDDQLQAYQARVTNAEGAEVTVQVAPVAGKYLRTQLSLENHDSVERTQHELKRRAEEIRRTLQQFGLQTGSVEVLPSRESEPEGAYEPQEKPEPVKEVRKATVKPHIEETRTPFVE